MTVLRTIIRGLPELAIVLASVAILAGCVAFSGWRLTAYGEWGWAAIFGALCLAALAWLFGETRVDP